MNHFKPVSAIYNFHYLKISKDFIRLITYVPCTAHPVNLISVQLRASRST